MYSVCRTIHPATSVEHSVECRFYNLSEKNLIVAGSNQLSVYRIVHSKLEHIQSFELYGTIASLQTVTLASRLTCKRDSVVLSFNDAKLAVVEYNPESHDLKTLSLHYFEDDSLRDGCVTNNLHPPIVRVDPENRCISMLIYGKHIIILPLDKDEEEEFEDDLLGDSFDGSSDEDVSMAALDTTEQSNHLQRNGRVSVMKQNNNNNNNNQVKSAFLPSYRLDLSEDVCGEKIDNIVDIQFLQNYNDPTLVLLHEPNKTWSGRVAIRQDTFSMVAFSLNTLQRLQPIIWSVNNLPFDSLKILPVPKPVGGLLVIACNELIYLNQSVPALGMSFNAFTADSSEFPVIDYEKNSEGNVETLDISLDLSQAVFLNHNKILFILKDGDVYLVTLFNDDMRSIKNFHFEHIASTVQPNCLTLCDNNLLFVGSHIGDSVMAEIVGDLKASNMESYDGDDLDSIMSGNAEKHQAISFQEHDKLISSSASGRICYGEAPSNSMDHYNHHTDPHVEVITTSGYHKDGSICVFQRGVRPVVEDTYELKHCQDLWLIKQSRTASCGSRLILSRQYESLIFSTKGELSEIKGDECAFETREPTVFAMNIGEEVLTLQILTSGARLISDDKIIDELKFESPVCDASAAEPHVIALSTTGAVYHIQVIQDRLACQDLGNLTSGQLVLMSIYEDRSGTFTRVKQSTQTTEETSNSNKSSTYWLLTVNDGGVFEIFSMVDFSLVYSVDNFPVAPTVLSDNTKLFNMDLDPNLPKIREVLLCGMGLNQTRPILFVRNDYELYIYEAFALPMEVETTPNKHLRIRFRRNHSILLNTLVPGELPLEYQRLELPSYSKNQNGQLAITGASGANSRRSRSSSSKNNRTHRELPNVREHWLGHRHWLQQFRNVGGYSGVFLAGFRPHWFIMTDRGAIRMHPMNSDGAVFAFSPYDDGRIIYYTENRELKIGSISSRLTLDAHWPMTKLVLGETVHYVTYHLERRVYCIVTSSPKPCLKLMKVGSEPDTMKIENLEREYGYIPPTTEHFRLRLFDPEKWEEVPDCDLDFEEWEQVTCMRNVLLASEGTTSGLKAYIAISTNYCYGEDVPNRGKIWILDLIEVVPEPDKPLTRNKIKKLYCQEQKGPVTTLAHCCGLLMSAVGQKIYLWQLKEERLDGVAFIDTQVYIHCVASVKNLILVSDVCKSVTLLRFQQETRTLSMVSRDSRPLEVFACDFSVDNEMLSFVVTDSEKNLIVYVYEPENEESQAGTRLLRRADIHLGSHVTSLSRLRGKVPKIHAMELNLSQFYRRRQLTIYCTVDGALGYLYPIDEPVHHRLQMLQNELTISLPHHCGLNPKSWRLVKHARPTIISPCRSILDGDLVVRFMGLSLKERNDIARRIGSSSDLILADLQQLHEATLYC